MKALLAIVGLLLATCGPVAAQQGGPAAPINPQGKISHVVIIDQENRSVDDLFQLMPGVNVSSFATISTGKQVQVRPVSICSETPCNCVGGCASPQAFNPNHLHATFEKQYANGRMNGWDLTDILGNGSGGPQCAIEYCAIAYVPQNEVQPYYDMAQQYAFADNAFQANRGPSHPSHQYLISGSSQCENLCIDATKTWSSATPPPTNPAWFSYWASDNGSPSGGGCSNTSGNSVNALDQFDVTYPGLIYSCYDRNTMPDELMFAGLTWSYYQSGAGNGLWKGPVAVWHLFNNANYSNWVKYPPYQFITDVNAGTLKTVTWVTPSQTFSDHADDSDGSGPAWVACAVNAIGNSPFWNSTIIIVTWDDWGGWFDHVAPPLFNPYEVGFRVPLIVISPYAKAGYISHVQHISPTSTLTMIEHIFGLPSLGAQDTYADDLADMFNFNQAPIAFTPISLRSFGNGGCSYFAGISKNEEADPVDY